MTPERHQVAYVLVLLAMAAVLIVGVSSGSRDTSSRDSRSQETAQMNEGGS